MTGIAADKTRLAVVVFSAAFDKVHYALMMAAAALAINRPVTLFFTMGACKALLADSIAGPGWSTLDSDSSGLSPEDADDALRSRGVGGFEDLLCACVALGATVMVCEAGLRAMDLDQSPLRPDVPVHPGGLTTFLEKAGGDLVFV